MIETIIKDSPFISNIDDYLEKITEAILDKLLVIISELFLKDFQINHIIEIE